MVIYKVIIHIQKNIEKEWISWMKKEHIPEIMALNIFNKSKIFNVLKSEENYFSSYCIEYHCTSIEKYNEYKDKYSKGLQNKHLEKFKGKFTSKRLILSIKNEF